MYNFDHNQRVLDEDNTPIELDLLTYANMASKFNLYPKECAYTALGYGVFSETGELIGLHKKAMRKDKNVTTEKYISESGDILWYTSQVGLLVGHLPISTDRYLRYNIDGLLNAMAEMSTLIMTTEELWAIPKMVRLLHTYVYVGHGYTLQDIMHANLYKLSNRFNSNTIRGDTR